MLREALDKLDASTYHYCMITLSLKPPHYGTVTKAMSWVDIVPDHPDADRYENTSLHCYGVDRRITIRDVMYAKMAADAEETFYLEQRLEGMAL